MGAVVLDVVDADLRLGGRTPEAIQVAAQVANSDAVSCPRRQGGPSRRDGPRRARRPSARGGRPDSREMATWSMRSGSMCAQAVLGGQRREARPVFDAVEPLLLHGGHKLAVREKGGGGVAVEGVKTEDVHE